MKETIGTIIENATQDGIHFRYDLESTVAIGGMVATINVAFYTQPIFNPRVKAECIVFNPMLIDSEFNCTRFARVLFHELGHATGNRFRLNRANMCPSIFQKITEKTITRKDMQKMNHIEEIVAERISQKLMEHFKIIDAKQKLNSVRYIDKYMSSEMTKMTELDAYKAEKEADEGFNYILQNWVTKRENVKKAA